MQAVATLDKDFQCLEFGPGTHRLLAAYSWLFHHQNVNDGWQVFEGEITGEGNGKHNQFRPGTAYIRPMFIVNYRNGTVCTSQVAELECWDLFENRQLVPNPRFRERQTGLVNTLRPAKLSPTTPPAPSKPPPSAQMPIFKPTSSTQSNRQSHCGAILISTWERFTPRRWNLAPTFIRSYYHGRHGNESNHSSERH